MKRIHIIGCKNSGKTSLIVDLVEHLTNQGLRVGTIKHTHHQHELDTPGKDSHRHRLAGAAAVGVISQGISAAYWMSAQEDTDDRYDRFSSLFVDCDLVLVEGHSNTRGTKIEVWRTAASSQPLALDDDSIKAIVTDDPIETHKPVWPRSDIDVISGHLLNDL